MWIVVRMASNIAMANDMQTALETEGLLVKMQDISSATKRSKNTFEVLVLESELDSAREILQENGF